MIVCVGQSELDAARKILRHDRIAYLPNGVDTQKFRAGNAQQFRAKHGIPADAFVVLNVSRIDEQKNQLELVEAFKHLLAKEPKAILTLIGPETQPAYAAKIRTSIQRHGLENSVRWLPGMQNDNPDLVDAYHACDVFVLPSLHEPFGIVVLEAWSASKPVIASHVGGLKTLISDNETGLFANGVEALTAQLLRLHASESIRHSLGEAGCLQARMNYDWPRIHLKLEAIYQLAEETSTRRHHSTKTVNNACPA